MSSPPLPLSQLRFPVQYIEVTEALVKARHGRVAAVRTACGLPPAGAPEQPAWIDGNQLMRSVDLAVEHCLPDAPPSLQILRHFPLTAHGTLGVFAITSHTVGEALDAALRYHALVMPLFDFRRQPDTAEGARVRVVPTVDVGAHQDLMVELVIGVLRNVAPYTTVQAPVLHAEFAHTSAWPAQAYEDFFGIAPRFGAPWHGFSVSRALLDAPLITGNRATRAHLEAMMLRDAPAGAQARPLTQRVRQLLLAGLRKGVLPDSEALSHELAMSARTLSRRLQDEGQSLTRLVEQVRIERAEQLLREGHLSVQDIAQQAGFADASSFTRAFKRATGHTPADQRERLRAAGFDQR
ncbi:MAG: AraC family transcriptional regulator ligand-binding domain-containing protein [Burkholderiales bacterium]|nr:AraC family transcriptional regulator ligand-binding domain-containing protein [Burkholderiales bacterium]MBH2016040.1 AraC family transcriptional regulator ligand-binding domain-containing protein [Burkholderiales bacterium]